MPTETERKFLLRSDAWRDGAVGKPYRQGYLSIRPTVRVRVAGDQGFITIKGPPTGYSRAEYEYQIPASDAAEMLETLCLSPVIAKTRYRVAHAGQVWEIDEFEGQNAGLIVAELEFVTPHRLFEPPDWVGEEVTGDPRYNNSSLVDWPYSKWGQEH
ncbi:MAG: CYTH domain-containing protein [Meiothermus sp.]|nr:CYTH domain-containing protein [Meiothermus sp.]